MTNRKVSLHACDRHDTRRLPMKSTAPAVQSNAAYEMLRVRLFLYVRATKNKKAPYSTVLPPLLAHWRCASARLPLVLSTLLLLGCLLSSCLLRRCLLSRSLLSRRLLSSCLLSSRLLRRCLLRRHLLGLCLLLCSQERCVLMWTVHGLLRNCSRRGIHGGVLLALHNLPSQVLCC